MPLYGDHFNEVGGTSGMEFLHTAPLACPQAILEFLVVGRLRSFLNLALRYAPGVQHKHWVDAIMSGEPCMS